MRYGPRFIDLPKTSCCALEIPAEVKINLFSHDTETGNSRYIESDVGNIRWGDKSLCLTYSRMIFLEAR